MDMFAVFLENPHVYEKLKRILGDGTDIIIRMFIEKIWENSKFIEPMKSEDKESEEKMRGIFRHIFMEREHP